ncbi:MAG: hypothetical protein FRX49_09316 [Trebouxia sp. A1-2]|nr:MAG: hypothetical protein FRX49_09316 [Trebouxia sp. A1-2]
MPPYGLSAVHSLAWPITRSASSARAEDQHGDAYLMMFCMLHGLLASSVWKPSVHDGKDDSVLMPRVFSVNQMEGLELGRKGTNGGRKGRGHAISRSLKACHALSNALLCQDRGSSPGQERTQASGDGNGCIGHAPGPAAPHIPTVLYEANGQYIHREAVSPVSHVEFAAAKETPHKSPTCNQRSRLYHVI